jgi:hypothetical protein
LLSAGNQRALITIEAVGHHRSVIDSLQSVIVSNTDTDKSLRAREDVLSVTSAGNTIIDDILGNHMLGIVSADTGIQNILIHGSGS